MRQQDRYIIARASSVLDGCSLTEAITSAGSLPPPTTSPPTTTSHHPPLPATHPQPPSATLAFAGILNTSTLLLPSTFGTPPQHFPYPLHYSPSPPISATLRRDRVNYKRRTEAAHRHRNARPHICRRSRRLPVRARPNSAGFRAREAQR